MSMVDDSTGFEDEKVAPFDGENLRAEPRVTRYGCGIYEVGDYVKLFITDSGHVIPVNHRILCEEDLMQAYVWGREDGRSESAPAVEVAS